MSAAYGLAAAPPSTNIFVAGLPQGIDDNRLREVFSAYGEVVWCKVLREGRDGRVPGLVEFSNLEHATWVVANVNGGIPQGLSDPVDVKFKDEKSGFSGGGGGGYGKEPCFCGKGAARFSPYGPPDSTGFDAYFHQAYNTVTSTQGKGGVGMGVGVGPPPRTSPEIVPNDNVYVKGLPLHTDEALLKQVFGAFGSVTQCRVCPGGETRRTALVRFSNVDEAALAIQSCSSSVLSPLTEPVEVRYAENWDSKQRRSSDGTDFSIDVIVRGFEQSGLMPGGVGRFDNNNSCALYIAGLPSDTTDFHLYKMFSPLGPIAPKGVRALLNDDGSCKGIAFVNYQREDSVHAAIGVYNGALLPDGTKLKVQHKAQKPPPQVCAPPAMPLVSQEARIVPPPPGGINAGPESLAGGGEAVAAPCFSPPGSPPADSAAPAPAAG